MNILGVGMGILATAGNCDPMQSNLIGTNTGSLVEILSVIYRNVGPLNQLNIE